MGNPIESMNTAVVTQPRWGSQLNHVSDIANSSRCSITSGAVDFTSNTDTTHSVPCGCVCLRCGCGVFAFVFCIVSALLLRRVCLVFAFFCVYVALCGNCGVFALFDWYLRCFCGVSSWCLRSFVFVLWGICLEFDLRRGLFVLVRFRVFAFSVLAFCVFVDVFCVLICLARVCVVSVCIVSFCRCVIVVVVCVCGVRYGLVGSCRGLSFLPILKNNVITSLNKFSELLSPRLCLARTPNNMGEKQP